MKANRKFLLRRDDEAVSPVIAVILMVAITVVLAATVYVWVSGFSNSSSTPAKSIALTSAAPLQKLEDWKNFTVASATPGLKYESLKVTLDGTSITIEEALFTKDTDDNKWGAVRESLALEGTDLVKGGDTFWIHGLTGKAIGGKTMRILDPDSNSVILSLNIAG